jgi:hypothetical protein
MGVCASSEAVTVDIGQAPPRGGAKGTAHAQAGDGGGASGPPAGTAPGGSMILRKPLTNGASGSGGGGTHGKGSSLRGFSGGVGGDTPPGTVNGSHSHHLSVTEKLAGMGLGMKRSSTSSLARSSVVSLVSLQSGHNVDVRSLPELPPALFLSAIFNDVAFFKVRSARACVRGG